MPQPIAALPAHSHSESLEGKYPPGVDWNTPLDKITLVEMFNKAVAEYGDRPCIDFFDRKLSFAELAGMVDKAAKGFQDMGVKKGTRVGLYMPNTPWYPIMFFGALKAGAIVVNYSPAYAKKELAAQVDDSGTEILVTADLPNTYRNATGLLKEGKLDKVVAFHLYDTLPEDKSWLPRDLRFGLPVYKMLNRLTRFFQRAVKDKVHMVDEFTNNDGRYTPVDIDPDDTAVLQYTGGTTGVPKGAELTHYNLAANAQQIEIFFGQLAPEYDHDLTLKHGKSKIAAPLPDFHIFGMTTTMNMPIRMGLETIMLLNPRDLVTALKVIERARPGFATAVPKQVEGTIFNRAVKKHAHDHLKVVITGGSALPSAVNNIVRDNCNTELRPGYGLTEASPVLTANPTSGGKDGSAGIAFPGVEIRICDIDDPEKVLNIGETGEIQARGPNVMKGYWNKPEETAATMTKDGWLKTGDVGHLDEDHYLFITDRLKRMINVAGTGKKAWANVIENEIAEHPDVLECCVVTVNKGTDHEAAKAFIRPRPGKKLDEKDLRRHLKDRLSSHEIPRYYEFVSKPLPVLAGVPKPDWKKLEDQEAAKAQAQAQATPAPGV